MKIFVSGSRSIKKLPKNAIEALDRIIAQGFTVLVGDCYGTDALVQEYLTVQQYENVLVYHIGSRPRFNIGFEAVKVDGRRQIDKDAEMGRTADYGLAVWDGVSPGTRKNIAFVKTRIVLA